MKRFAIKSKIFLAKFIIVVGYTSGFVTILLAFWDEFSAKIDGYEVLGFSSLVLIDLLITVFLIWPKNKVSLKLSETVKTDVFFGDIFKQEGVVVIPVNEYFDTIVNDKIISSRTLHGVFVRSYFDGNEADLKKQISHELINVAYIDKNLERSAGNKKRYPLGTVCQVKKDEKTFFLVALTKFNKNDRAEVKNSEYQRVLCDLFSYIEQNSQDKRVNIPLIGAGHSGVKLSIQKKLEFLLFSVHLKDNLTLIGGVNIVLHSSIKSEIDLNSTEILFNSIGS